MLGDIDMNADDNESGEPTFYFSLDEVKNKFFDFLSLSTEAEESGEADDVVDHNEYEEQGEEAREEFADREVPPTSARNQEAEADAEAVETATPHTSEQHAYEKHAHEQHAHEQHAHEQHSPSPVAQELEDLDENNSQKVHTDFKYWKPVIDYTTTEDILSEMNK